MYTLLIAVLYSEASLRGAVSGQHPKKLSPVRCGPEGRMVPLGFCSGGFSSTAGYVPGKRGLISEDIKRLCTQAG